MAEIHYLISDASKKVDVEAHVLRYWEEELGLVIPRNEMGHRYYTDFHVRLFRQVKRLKEKGYQLKAIKTALDRSMADIQAAPGELLEADVQAALQETRIGEQEMKGLEKNRLEKEKRHGAVRESEKIIGMIGQAETGNRTASQPIPRKSRLEVPPSPEGGGQREEQDGKKQGTSSAVERKTGNVERIRGERAALETGTEAESEGAAGVGKDRGEEAGARKDRGEEAGAGNDRGEEPEMGTQKVQPPSCCQTGAPGAAEAFFPAERMEQFQRLMNLIIGRAMEENSEKISQDISCLVHDKMVKEMEYLMRVSDEREEERFKRLDEAIRAYQRENQGRAEAAASVSLFPFLRVKKKRFGRNGNKLL